MSQKFYIYSGVSINYIFIREGRNFWRFSQHKQRWKIYGYPVSPLFSFDKLICSNMKLLKISLYLLNTYESVANCKFEFLIWAGMRAPGSGREVGRVHFDFGFCKQNNKITKKKNQLNCLLSRLAYCFVHFIAWITYSTFHQNGRRRKYEYQYLRFAQGGQ